VGHFQQLTECGKTKTTKKNKTTKKLWQWDWIHQQAFNNVKATIAKEVVLAYPDFLKPFEIYTDASAMQLGAKITQDNMPIAFFSRKLSSWGIMATFLLNRHPELLTQHQRLHWALSVLLEIAWLERRVLLMGDKKVTERR
jgi:hypothetical protein